jgi:hypothetical protein
MGCAGLAWAAVAVSSSCRRRAKRAPPASRPPPRSCVWLPGARLNIADAALNCPRAPKDAPAVLWAAEGRPRDVQAVSRDELRKRCRHVASCVAARFKPGARARLSRPSKRGQRRLRCAPQTYESCRRRLLSATPLAAPSPPSSPAPGTALAINMPMTVESVVIYLGIVLAGCRWAWGGGAAGAGRAS